MARKANIYFQDQLAGTLVEGDSGYWFYYRKEYLQKPDAKPVSLTLPLSEKGYHSNVLFHFSTV